MTPTEGTVNNTSPVMSEGAPPAPQPVPQPATTGVTEGTAAQEEELFCICRRPYKVPSFMVECDACNQWLHGACVGVLPTEAVRIDKYICPECEPIHGPSLRTPPPCCGSPHQIC